jgi:hypothetical protein
MMKLHPLILGVIGAAALASGAIGAVDREVSSGHQTKHHGVSASRVRTKTGKTGLKPSAPSVPLSIYQPAPLEVPAVHPSYTCASAATDCSPGEACEIWGVNCDQLGAAGATSADTSGGAGSTDRASADTTPDPTGK